MCAEAEGLVKERAHMEWGKGREGRGYKKWHCSAVLGSNRQCWAVLCIVGHCRAEQCCKRAVLGSAVLGIAVLCSAGHSSAVQGCAGQ